ncbi:MAG: helix-turn-helix domain-containing protein [Clostridia bacterium]
MKNNILGNRIANLRRNNSLSQIEFSKILNISNTTLSQYESGKRIPSDNVKIQIADYFNVSLDYLFGRTDIIDTADSILNIASTPNQLHASYEDNDIPPEAAEEIIKFKDYLMHKYSKAKDK